MQLQDYSCVLCACGIDEEISHLLFHCPFSLACWNTLHLVIPNALDPPTIAESLKVQLQLPFFMEIIITMIGQYLLNKNKSATVSENKKKLGNEQGLKKIIS